MRRKFFLLTILLLFAVASVAKVNIRLVKTVPPGTNSQADYRPGRNPYSPSVYYEFDTLYIQYPIETVSSVVITDLLTDQVIIDEHFDHKTTSIKVPIGSLVSTESYKVKLSAFGSLWNGTFDYFPELIELDEQEITLRIGESRQLNLLPAQAKVRWIDTGWNSMDNPYIFKIVDENGIVTALRAGNAFVMFESVDGSIRKQTPITILNEGNIRTDRIQFDPVDECEWRDVQFTLTDDGRFIAQGTYYGSGAQPSYLNYTVTDQCVFLSFDINYEDSTKMFYPQPFSLEINDCNAEEFYVYFNNRSQLLQSQDKFVKYAIRRGSSIGGTTNPESIVISNYDDLIYNLKGQKLNTVPEQGVYIRNGVKQVRE